MLVGALDRGAEAWWDVIMCAAKMHPDEADIDLSLVGRLIATQFPQWADLPIASVASSGTDNAMFRLGRDMAVRLPRMEDVSATVELEQHWMPRLAPHLPFAISTPLGKGAPSEGYPWAWSVYQWLEGRNPVVGEVAAPDVLAMDLAEFIQALRAIDTTGAGPAFRGMNLAERDDATRDSIKRLDGIIDTDAAAVIWDEVVQTPEWTGPDTWMHGDITPGNILLTDDRLSAVIDFGGVGIGNPTVDLIVAWNLLPREVRDDFRTAMRATDDDWVRGRGWALSVAVCALPYYLDTNPGIVANSRNSIEQVIDDHRRNG